MNTTKNPWTTLKTTEVYQNPWISIRHNDVISPGGKQGIYGTAHFKNIAIAVIPIDDDGFTWLVGQYRYPLKAYSWEVVEGGCPEGEDFEQAARRELLEETGLTAEKYTQIAIMHTSNSVTDEVGYIYIAEGLTQGEAQPDHTEQLQVKKVHIKEAIEMVMNNQITDSLSCYGLLKVSKLMPHI
jgi:8-oxo-dGTP pyrophosphatase MutT (NUDIX family)